MAKELKLYLPVIFRDITEYMALSNAETPFLEDLEDKTNKIVEDAFLTTMSEPRLAEWENALGIVATNVPLEQRRSVVLSRFRGTGKLNKTLIHTMVNAFTGGTASVNFANGIINVRVAPPTPTFLNFSVDKLTEELSKRKPAHLLLNVEFSYISWGTIKNNISTWGDLRNNFTNWNEVYAYYTT